MDERVEDVDREQADVLDVERIHPSATGASAGTSVWSGGSKPADPAPMNPTANMSANNARGFPAVPVAHARASAHGRRDRGSVSPATTMNANIAIHNQVPVSP